MDARRGRTISIAASSPASAIHNFPSAATLGRPNTGAATKCCPRLRCSNVRRSERATLMVLSDTWVAPGAIADATPPLPSTTSLTASSSFSMVKTRSRPCTASCALDGTGQSIKYLPPAWESDSMRSDRVPPAKAAAQSAIPFFPDLEMRSSRAASVFAFHSYSMRASEFAQQ